MRRSKKILWLVPTLFVLAALTLWLSNLLTDNFHTVIPNKLYRSAQLTPENLAILAKRYHIRSVINLRGAQPGGEWYQGEIQMSKRLKIRHYDLKLQAQEIPARNDLKTLVKMLQTAPQPILVHCRQGADRTGLASAIGVILYAEDLGYAKKQVSFRYNVVSPSTLGYQVLQNYFVWLSREHLSFGKNSFLRWLNGDVPLEARSGYYF